MRVTKATRLLRVVSFSDEIGSLALYIPCADLAAQAVEHWLGTTYAHALIQGPKLARKDLLLELDLELNP